jgi:hypothetical protein
VKPTSNALPIAALAIGGVGVVVGTIFGISAMGNKSSLNDKCVNKVCPASSQSDIDSFSRNGTISTVGFAIGIVGLATGTVLLLTSGGGSSAESTPAPAGAEKSAARVTPWISPTGAGLSGTF